jgi:hypothetical protein
MGWFVRVCEPCVCVCPGSPRCLTMNNEAVRFAMTICSDIPIGYSDLGTEWRVLLVCGECPGKTHLARPPLGDPRDM